MTKLEELSRRAAAEIPADPKSGGVGFDPVTIALLIEVVIKIIIYVYDCWKAAHPDSLKKVNKPGFFLRWRLQRVVRKVLTRNGAADQVDATVKAILKMGATVTLDDLTAVLGEVAKDATASKLAAEYQEA
jgi:hypothetical protein